MLQDEASGSNVPSRPLPGMEDSEAAVSTLEEDVRCNISIMQITLSYPGFSFEAGRDGKFGWFFELVKKREIDLTTDKCEILCLRQFNIERQ